MTAGEPAPGTAPAPRVLVVDDDRRVVELLEIAFEAHGFKVLSAADGEEAIQRTLAERPDLVVLDVRLPKKSGLDVCEWLRRDPDDPDVPIIVVSATIDTETRLLAFKRGADDYLAKPFSPKELIARVKRLLARSAGTREARDRARDLERELARAREEAKRAHLETRREQRLRELAFGLGHDLHRTLDPDELARRLLTAAQSRLGVGMAGLLLPDGPDRVLAPAAVRGDGLERLSGVALAPDGGLAALLAGLGRPVLRRDLERFPELADEVPALVAAGVAVVAPLRDAEGLTGVLLLDERLDGLELAPADIELLSGLCALAATALANALRARTLAERALALLAERCAPAPEIRPALVEAGTLAAHAARATLLPPRQRTLLAHGVALAHALADAEARRSFEAVAADDATGLLRDLGRLVADAATPAPAGERAPEDARAAALLAAALRHAGARAAGATADEALARALADSGDALDPTTRQALAAAAREASASEVGAL
ncbi:MAG: response regulator transcription factor [Candidatus Eisenbacteria bacterium]|nr:response regulator transcription factor [Candidatus Eisenbacteria bacterium]